MTIPDKSTQPEKPEGLPEVQDEPESRPGGIPLYIWVIAAVLIAIPVGRAWGDGAASLELLPRLILRALTALAAPLVVLAILSAIVTNEIRGRLGGLMMGFYLLNTFVAMIIGLALTNLIQPGIGASLSGKAPSTPPPHKSISDLLIDLVPRSIGEPFTQNHLAQLVVLTLALGIGLVKIRDAQKAKGERSFQVVVDLLTIGFELLMKVLLWVVALSPLAVFGVVASVVGQREAMDVLRSLIALIGVVALGLALQVTWYLAQMVVLAGMSPLRFLRRGPRRHGEHVQHGQHGRHDPDHAAIPRPAGGLAAIEPVDGLHRHELQQRRDRTLPGDGGPVHRPGARLQPEPRRPGDGHADDADRQRRRGRDPVGQLRDDAADLRRGPHARR